ncbi:hypothetical protein [Ideonella margarita]|uniref:Uncharacterized protein n=1 Tax=Ideonella margarita TaxID=2984191 RepID=A0ABU9C4U6_9BURK
MTPRTPLRWLGGALTAACLALAALALLGLAQPAAAQDRADLAPSQIIGNRELPKVLYIVPWKKPLPDALNGKPPVSVLDEVLSPLDRDVFRRQQRLQTQAGTQAQAQAQTTSPATAPAATDAAKRP